MRPGTIVLSLLAFVAAGCHQGVNKSGGPTGPTDVVAGAPGFLAFRASPIALSEIRFITPLGNLNPPAHTIPTDHIYFYFAAPDAGETPIGRRTDFFAPADGVIRYVITTDPPDTKIGFQASATLTYYVDHLIPSIPLTMGTKVTAGQRIGTSGSAYGIDLGVVNTDLTLAFANPSRYAIGDTLHADAPLKYFDEPLRSQLYSRVQRIGGELDGQVNQDVAGRLAGNWYEERTSTQIAFVFDTYDPSQIRISIAAIGGVSRTGVFAVAPGDPSPRDVSVASGPIVYTLTTSRSGPPVSGAPAGRLLVQMTDDQHLQVELVPSGGPASFTSNAVRYTR
ncbi:MAG TPA: hypothetical protein VFA59_04750 [Vicinamibacterales bacterium]|nr:hypothetical protein [Vicinamibacterales bacterium]